MNARTKLRKKLNRKPYRDAFVGSQISVGIPFQVRALRARKGLSQKQLAAMAGMAQPRISAIETPGGGHLNLETLRRIASAFDVGLIVRFAPFSELIRFADSFSPDEFDVLDFAADMATTEEAPELTGNVVPISTGRRLSDVSEGAPRNVPKPVGQATVTTLFSVKAGQSSEARTEESAKTDAEIEEVNYA